MFPLVIMEKYFNDFLLSFTILLWFFGVRHGPLNKGFVLFLDVVLFICFVFLAIKYCLKFWHQWKTMKTPTKKQ
ncbi:MAG TPA: hypothetical protein DD791_09405 [Syntrophomonas sp.]|nr:hypothetical protein [Syntrophomonas sp.]